VTRGYDTIVIGLGGMGSAACAHLAARGQKVLGIEQFELGHSRGSSHGETRVIRAAYFEHPNYVPLLLRAYELWGDLEDRAGYTLFHRSGVLVAGPPESAVVQGVLRSASQHGLAVDELGREATMKRFPQFSLPEGFRSAFEPDAGYLEVENCVLRYLRAAEDDGASFRIRERVLSWQADARSVRVTTAAGEYEAARLVITTGAWFGNLLRELEVGFKILRKRLFWFQAGAEFAAASSMPCFFFDTAAGTYYGTPSIGQHGLKVAKHSGGEVLSRPDELLETGLGEGPSRARLDLDRVHSFMRTCLPRVPANPPLGEAVCMYEMSPDEHFILDRHPGHPNVFLAGGFSGHGFKFASVVGEILADFCETGTTKLPIDFLRLGRFQK
jgi:sarcosine oxidase